MPGSSSFFFQSGFFAAVLAFAALAYALYCHRRLARQHATQSTWQHQRLTLEQNLAESAEQTQQLRQELDRLRAEYNRFAYIVSHDLKEPLRSITSFSNLLERRLGDSLPAEAQQYLDFITDGSRHLQALLDGLLQYSRAGAPLQAPQPVALGPLLERVQARYAAVIEETAAELEVGELPLVSGDPQRLLQLFQHLLGNALKFHGAAPPRLRIQAQPQGKFWLLSIADKGIGIDPKQQQRVFDVFQRLHAREDYPGIGIGLPLCKRIVESHSGQMWLESTPEQGTTIWFTLPASEQPRTAV